MLGGMAATGLVIAIASDISYGPHPYVPLMAGEIGRLMQLDDTRGIVVSEEMVEVAPAYDCAFPATIYAR